MAPTKPLTPAEVTALEHAFAADPTSRDAYRALTEAYLAAGRFMEAMVVCKKGVKAHPDDPSARVLLARVYADQGKDRKALEELAAVLQSHPRDASANRMAGVLHLRLGEKEPGTAALRRAAEAAPGDKEIAELLRAHGVSGAATPARAPARPQAPAPGAQAAAAARAPPPSAVPPPPRPRAGAPTRETVAPVAPFFDVDLMTPAPGTNAREAGLAYAKELAEKYATQEFTLTGTTGLRLARKKRSKATIITTVSLFAFLALALGGWVALSKARKARIEKIDKLLREARELVEKDSYQGYRDAAARCEGILDADSGSLAGHAYLAYIDAILVFDHGAGDAARTEAVTHVDAAHKLGRHSHLIAAEAYLRFAGGDPSGAVKDLKSFIDAEEAQSPLLQGTLGILQMQSGDLDAARDTLSKAQKANPGDVRIASMLAEQFRRRGEGYELQASGFFDYALRIQKEHVPSLLGKAELLLDRGQINDAGKLVAAALAPSAGASPRQQAVARVIRGTILAAMGKTTQGRADEEAALKADPANPDLPYLVAKHKLRDGDAAAAAEWFQKALTMDPRRMNFYVDLVKALLRKDGGAKQAVDVLKKAITRLGESPRLALLLGDAYRASGDADLARGQYEKAIQLGRPFPDARVALAKMYRAQNNVPGALVELTQAIDEYGQGGAGGAAQAYVEMAETERARGARKEVLLDLFEKALERDPASCEALWGAGKAEVEAKRLTDQAKQRLEAYAKLCPRSAHADEAARLAAAK